MEGEPRFDLNLGLVVCSQQPDGKSLLYPFDVVVPTGKQDVERILSIFRGIQSPIGRYLFLRKLCEDDANLHFRAVVQHASEFLPFIYTPTVGEACQRYDALRIRTRGLYVTLEHRGRIAQRLRDWPGRSVRVIVVTDGERILGLGDLGTGGMGISEGKITLYTAAAGLSPHVCMPVCLDVGTDNEKLLEDPAYRGLRRKRLRGPEYDAFVGEFMAAVRAWQPHCLVQFEDFGNKNAFRVLEHHRNAHCCFNDDIQGTACITLAGLLSALQVTPNRRLGAQRLLFFGAGEAGTGIGELVSRAIAAEENIPLTHARTLCSFMDSKGLVTRARRDAGDLQEHKLPFAHDAPACTDLLEAVRRLKPTALVGVSTIGGAFTPEVLRAMAEINERPIVFPLSNPTPLAECTFEQALECTGGRVVFASGSPFPPVETRAANGAAALRYAAQANNAYIFPALGHAAVLARAARITDAALLVAARALAEQASTEMVEQGLLFPPFAGILEVSARIAEALVRHFVAEGTGAVPPGVHARRDGDVARFVRSAMWFPARQMIERDRARL
ncbi:unnamed protein product [Pedinophyceae sp. YPF-701]|nr:unnamed protein product [Pedinophyceae sp. YPF-701]